MWIVKFKWPFHIFHDHRNTVTWTITKYCECKLAYSNSGSVFLGSMWRSSYPRGVGVDTAVLSLEGGEVTSGAESGGLRAVMLLLQGGRTLIISRPHVAKLMFIWAARRKFFPVQTGSEDGSKHLTSGFNIISNGLCRRYDNFFHNFMSVVNYTSINSARSCKNNEQMFMNKY